MSEEELAIALEYEVPSGIGTEPILADELFTLRWGVRGFGPWNERVRGLRKRIEDG